VIYPDLGFVLSLLVRGANTQKASVLLRDLPHPLPLSLVHRLQVENGLLRSLHSSDPERILIGKNGLLLWRAYLQEEIFVLQEFDLEATFVQAAVWNAAYKAQPPRWGLLLHPAIAAITGWKFMSFDPALRKRATDAGLEILPPKL
jgi:hypothetical protein